MSRFLPERELSPGEKAEISKGYLVSIMDRVRMDQGLEIWGRGEFDFCLMCYNNILDKLGNGFSATDVAKLLLALLITTDVESKPEDAPESKFENPVTRLVSTKIDVLDTVTLPDKKYPSLDELSALFVAEKSEFKKKLKLVELVRLIVHYKLPFAYWYFEMVEKAARVNTTK